MYSINTNISIQINKKESIMERNVDDNDWLIGYFINKEKNMLFVYGSRDIHVYDIEKKKIAGKLTRINRGSNLLSTAIYTNEYRYIIAGYISGEIIVWKFGLRR